MELQQQIRVAVDAVVFGYRDNQLQILLIQQKYGTQKGKWALPGGFVKDTETLDHAVKRELLEETGVSVNYLEQLYTFGAIERDPRFRVVSIAYMALVNPNNFMIKADTDAEDVKWFNVNEVPELAFDHNEILQTGLKRLKAKIHYEPIGFELLEKEFPFSAIENLYQTILSQKIDRRNFRKKLLSFGFITETDKIHKPVSGRPAKLFTIDFQKYNALKQTGFHFEIKFA